MFKKYFHSIFLLLFCNIYLFGQSNDFEMKFPKLSLGTMPTSFFLNYHPHVNAVLNYGVTNEINFGIESSFLYGTNNLNYGLKLRTYVEASFLTFENSLFAVGLFYQGAQFNKYKDIAINRIDYIEHFRYNLKTTSRTVGGNLSYYAKVFNRLNFKITTGLGLGKCKNKLESKNSNVVNFSSEEFRLEPTEGFAGNVFFDVGFLYSIKKIKVP
jgi:hypothetical protein